MLLNKIAGTHHFYKRYNMCCNLTTTPNGSLINNLNVLAYVSKSLKPNVAVFNFQAACIKKRVSSLHCRVSKLM